MDVKDLNKSQLILLAILISFVVSIATSISTVTLMEQAPPSVTVPINRIVRQTVEKIQQVEGKTTVQTIIIKEEDLIVDAIAKNKNAIFSITKEVFDEITVLTSEISIGKGFVISNDGIVVVDAVFVSEKGTYFVKNDSGKFKADFISTDKAGFSFLKIGAPLDEKNKVNFIVPVFGDLNKMKVGQKVIVLGDNISSFIYDGSKNIMKDIKINKSNAGALVFNLDGDVLGIALFGDVSTFAPISVINDSLKPKEIITEIPKL